jgi:hypothetical protein
MLSIKTKNWMFLAAGVVILTLAGCHARPYDYEPAADEMKKGPGVFSGEDGEFTIYDSKKGDVFPQDPNTKASETTAKPTAQTSATAGAAATTAAGAQAGAQPPAKTPAGARDYQEFQEYQKWQKTGKGSSDYQQFQEYQQWRRGSRNSADYQEFLEWKEFKAYQEWKKSQQ